MDASVLVQLYNNINVTTLIKVIFHCTETKMFE